MKPDQQSQRFSPKAIMKARQPDKFSDTLTVTERPLSRSLLEHHLLTLTARNQNTEFERFALTLCRHAICPNLRSQTGPTGGGDGKVDFENYPVVDQLALAWHVGEGSASSERWGFAVSAKKDWKPKVQSDIAKIASTNRGYRKAFFISNQFISDKKASELEDELSSKHGIKVRILSLNWLIDEVFTRNLDSTAIELLGIEVGATTVVQVGPLDKARSEELTSIDKRIEDAVREGRFTHDLVNHSLISARLARELERSRAEIEGRYLRATELAERFGTPHQSLIAVYQRAWTAFFWHEDFHLFDQLYSKVEEMATCSDNACHLELLNNLWNLAYTLGKLKVGSIGSDKLPSRTVSLADALTRLSNMEDRPTTALHARSMSLVQQITVTLPNTPKSVFADLRNVINSCGGLVGYPLKPLFEIVEHLEPLIENETEFELLFEEMVATASKQAGEVEGAMVIMRRGAQRLEKEKFYDAIALFGRALGSLANHETRQYLISGLNLLAHAYEKVGLLWAARGALLNSIALILNEYHSYSDSSRLRSGPISRLKWLELQLGRFSQCLEWLQIDVAVMESIGSPRLDEEDSLEEFQTFDLGLAILMLRARPEQLSHLTRFPDVLEQMGLYFTKGALLLLLGQEDDIYQQLAKEGQTANEVYENFLRQPMADDVSPVLIVDHGDQIALNSRIWGCSIQVTSPVESPFQELAESILAAMEATLATAGRERVIGAVPLINIRILRSSCPWFEFDLDQPTTSAPIELRCGSFDCSRLRKEDQFLIREKICEFTASILVRFFHIGDFESLTQKLFKEERSFERGTNLTTSFVTLANVLGRHPRTRLIDWIQGDETEYANQRSQPWMPSQTPPISRSPKPVASQAEAEPETKSWQGFGNINQRKIQSFSLIDSSLWDSAGWKGTAFMWDEGNKQPPLLGILFEHDEPAATIFANWRRELGTVDKEERLRVIIVKGISRTNPFAYRVCVTSNIKTAPDKSDGGYFMVTSRCNTMEPKNDHNLRSFLTQYQQFRCYWIIYATLASRGDSIQPVFSSSILKKSIVIRDAWEIGINDEDCMAIQPDDDPFTPPEVVDPPIHGLLTWMKNHT